MEHTAHLPSPLGPPSTFCPLSHPWSLRCTTSSWKGLHSHRPVALTHLPQSQHLCQVRLQTPRALMEPRVQLTLFAR